MEPNWAKIKNEYVSKGTPYRELTKKYGVNLKTLARHAKSEEWVRLREEYVNKLSTESLRKTQSQAIVQATRIQTATEKLLKKAEQLLELEDALAPRDLKALSATLLDARTLLGIKDDLDRQEQQARIDKARAELEAAKDNADGTIEIVWVKPPWESEAPPPVAE